MHRKVAGEFLHANVIMQLKITGSSIVDRVSIILRIRYCIYLSHVSIYVLKLQPYHPSIRTNQVLGDCKLIRGRGRKEDVAKAAMTGWCCLLY